VDGVDLDVGAASADAAIAALVLAAIDLVEVAVDADEEDVEAGQQRGELFAPGGELDDVVDDQVVARLGQRRDAAVEAGEEPRAHLVPPGERSGLVPARGEHADELVGRDVEERRVELFLQRPGQRRTAPRRR
jgi:hypothetical protein